MTAIKISGLTKRYKDVIAVDGIDLEIEQGELFGLLGVNGAGKSTTIKMLSTLTRPDAGDALICGYSIVGDSGKVKEIIDVSMQETSVARNLTVRENFEFYASLCGLSKKEAKEITAQTAADFSLSGVLDKMARTLSGGYQRRLSIALALISKPKVLFLDEPTLGLDVLARRELWSVIEKLKKDMTIILTTHYMEEAEALCDRIAVMNGGKIKAVGTSAELIALTGAKNFEDAFVALAGGEAV